MQNAADRYINERYIDALCRETGMDREQAVAALRRALDLPAGDLKVGHAPAVRPHNPLHVAIAIGVFGLAWTVVAGVVVLMIAGVL